MDLWNTTERFDAVSLNESLYHSAVDPREMFGRAIGWLAEDGIVIVSMFRGFGCPLHLVSGRIWRDRTAGCLRGERRHDKEGLGCQGAATL